MISRVRATVALSALAALLFLPFARPASGAEEKGNFRSATVCAECHAEIYAAWRSSHHASSFTDPAFQVPYDRIRRQAPRDTLPCERCHNPLRFYLEPGDPKASIFAQEGVTCDFCHSVEAASADEAFPRYRLNPEYMFGPYPPGRERGKSPHKRRFSDLHIRSEFCAGCHEYTTPYGVPILSTYTEWKESFYRGEGTHCQFCHLPQLFDPQFIPRADRKGPADHAMLGGHSRERLAGAILIRATLRVSGKEAQVAIRLKNETVGHKTPSGVPMHRIRLATTLYDADGNPLGRKDELFERVVGDGAGNPLRKPERIFTEAREVLKDNRIGPKETREVLHAFPLEGGSPATADVSLTYEIPTVDIAPGTGSIDIPISRTVVPVDPGTPTVYVALGALGGALLILSGWLLLGAFRKR